MLKRPHRLERRLSNMAEMVSNNNGGGKQKKMTVRVDFTPMVDMLMLLITFFMLCTSLSKPSTMELTMPSNDKNTPDAKKNEAKESHSITIYIADGDKMFTVKVSQSMIIHLG